MRILLYESENPMNDIRYPFKTVLEEMGHSVDLFDWSYYFFTKSRSNFARKVFDKTFFKLIQKKINEDLLVAASNGKYDVLLVMMGKYIYPETLADLKKHVKLLVNWSTDDIYNSNSSSLNVIQSVPLYDVIFSPRAHLFDEFKKAGAKSIRPIDWYPHPGLLNGKKIPLNFNKNHDISFIGSWSRYREEVLTPLLSLPSELVVYGWGWVNKTTHLHKQQGLQCGSSISLLKMQEIFEESKISINILTRENRDTTNLRNFEIPATRAFQLSERSEDVLRLFEEDREIVCFSGSDELKSKCNFYIKNDASREKIALAGYERVIKSRYTLHARLELVMSSMSGML